MVGNDRLNAPAIDTFSQRPEAKGGAGGVGVGVRPRLCLPFLNHTPAIAKRNALLLLQRRSKEMAVVQCTAHGGKADAPDNHQRPLKRRTLMHVILEQP